MWSHSPACQAGQEWLCHWAKWVSQWWVKESEGLWVLTEVSQRAVGYVHLGGCCRCFCYECCAAWSWPDTRPLSLCCRQLVIPPAFFRYGNRPQVSWPYGGSSNPGIFPSAFIFTAAILNYTIASNDGLQAVTYYFHSKHLHRNCTRDTYLQGQFVAITMLTYQDELFLRP